MKRKIRTLECYREIEEIDIYCSGEEGMRWQPRTPSYPVTFILFYFLPLLQVLYFIFSLVSYSVHSRLASLALRSMPIGSSEPVSQPTRYKSPYHMKDMLFLFFSLSPSLFFSHSFFDNERFSPFCSLHREALH